MTSLLRQAEGFFTSSPAAAPNSNPPASASSPHPARAGSSKPAGADLHRGTSLKYARDSDGSFGDERIKCSTCDEWVLLLDLGEHVCRVRRGQGGGQGGGLTGSASLGSGLDRVSGRERERERRANGREAVGGGGGGGAGTYGGGASEQRSPRYPDRHHDPVPYASNSNSRGPSPSPSRPTDHLVRSASYQSTTSATSDAHSASSSTAPRNLPFLDKYQKLAASTSSPTAGPSGSPGLTRSAGANVALAELSLSPTTGRTPSPGSGSRTPSPGWGQYNEVSPTTPTFAKRSGAVGAGGGGAARPGLQSSKSQDATTFRARGTGDRGGWQDARSEEERRETIKASQSTPNSLAGMARSGAAQDNRLRGATKPKTRRELDECMEDLRIMTEDDDRDGGAALLNEFFVERPQSKWAGTSDPRSTVKPPRLPFNQPPASNAGLTTSPSLAALRSNSSNSVARPQAVPTRRPTNVACSACHKLVDPASATLSGEQMPFCRPCYADRFLPRCRKCNEPITGGAVSSSDGKVAGKYHPACFSCAECDAPFPSGEFYVWDARPVCAVHYAALNNSLCANPACGRPVEGSCVSLIEEGGGRFHPEHFACAREGCGVSLGEMHWVLEGKPWCERHAVTSPVGATARMPRAGGEDGRTRARKRMTIVTRR